MSKQSDCHHVVIVGGGLAGLASAALLARAGQRVTVYERSSGLGGRAATHVHAGYHLNIGPHAVYRGGPASALLRALGVDVPGASPNVASALAIAGGRLHALPVGFASLVATSLLPLGAKLETAHPYRRRKRRGYIGPWLPTPVDTDDVVAAHEPRTTEGRYDLLESVSFAFLVALEALRPRERAVLLLRDVFDYSVRETAGALGLSEANVKTTHHRARRVMDAYDQSRVVPTRALADKTREALSRFMAALAMGDAAALEELLAPSACAINDGGGEFLAARVPVEGRAKVLTFFTNLAKGYTADARGELQMLNGMPAFVVEMGPSARADARRAPRFVMRCELDAFGKIRELQTILATPKLAAVKPLAPMG